MALATSCVFFKGLSSTKGAKALLGRAGLIFSDSRKRFGTKCSESRTSLEFLLIKICLPTSFFFFFQERSLRGTSIWWGALSKG